MRRNNLEPTAIQEQFIVPLISNNVTELIDKYVVENMNVLDIGCGEQPFRKTIECKGAKYFSLDIAQNSNNNVDFIYHIDGEIDLLIENYYNFILCTEVLEHVINWEKSFFNINKLCAEEGIIVFTCPFVYPIHEAPFDYWRPTPHTFEVFANKNSLKVIEQKKAGNFWTVLGTLFAHSYLENAKKSIFSKFKAKIVRWCFKYTINQILKYGYLTGVNSQSSFYSSNIIVLEKQST